MPRSCRGGGGNGAIEAARSGHNAIMTPGAFAISTSIRVNRLIRQKQSVDTCRWKSLQYYNPVPAGLTPTEAKHITGVQANLWTEYIATPERAEYQLYPRLLALAEVAWICPKINRGMILTDA